MLIDSTLDNRHWLLSSRLSKLYPYPAVPFIRISFPHSETAKVDANARPFSSVIGYTSQHLVASRFWCLFRTAGEQMRDRQMWGRSVLDHIPMVFTEYVFIYTTLRAVRYFPLGVFNAFSREFSELEGRKVEGFWTLLVERSRNTPSYPSYAPLSPSPFSTNSRIVSYICSLADARILSPHVDLETKTWFGTVVWTCQSNSLIWNFRHCIIPTMNDAGLHFFRFHNICTDIFDIHVFLLPLSWIVA